MLHTLTKRTTALAVLLAAALAASAVRAEPTTAPAGKATIAVAVVDGDGKAVVGAKVDLLPAPAKGQKKRAGKKAANPLAEDPTTRPAGHGAVQPLATATTDADGKATLPGVADGIYTVRARLKKVGNGRTTVSVADGKDVSVTVTIAPPKQKN